MIDLLGPGGIHPLCEHPFEDGDFGVIAMLMVLHMDSEAFEVHTNCLRVTDVLGVFDHSKHSDASYPPWPSICWPCVFGGIHPRVSWDAGAHRDRHFRCEVAREGVRHGCGECVVMLIPMWMVCFDLAQIVCGIRDEVDVDVEFAVIPMCLKVQIRHELAQPLFDRRRSSRL